MLSFDSNVLVYARDLSDVRRAAVASDILRRAPAVPSFLTQQAIGEFCNVVRRKRLLDAAQTRLQVEDWAGLYHIIPTAPDQLLQAVQLAEGRRKQFWDMVLVRVAADAGATTLLTEDIGDGEIIAGVRIVDPFNSANARFVDELLTPSPGTA